MTVSVSDSVCVCVCLSAIISSELHVRFSPSFFIYATYGRGSGLFWRRNDTLCTLSFMDDVIFAYKFLRLLNIAAELKRSAHVALSLAINGLS